MGRPRKPTHLKIVSGTAQKCRINAFEPRPAADLPIAPDWLSPRAAEIFRGIVTTIDAMRIASASDTNMLAMAASRLEEVEICTAQIEDGGRFFTSSV
jgi:phage terminase small subunit